jgi:hypothetical protein
MCWFLYPSPTQSRQKIQPQAWEELFLPSPIPNSHEVLGLGEVPGIVHQILRPSQFTIYSQDCPHLGGENHPSSSPLHLARPPVIVPKEPKDRPGTAGRAGVVF